MISEEKKTWAEELLRQKAKELGRLPTKKDFLGTWPQALEAAGLKEAKPSKN